MKKVLLVLITVLMIALPAAAYDFGGSLDLSGSYESEAFTPSAKATGWVKVPFETGAFSTEAYYDGSFANKTFTGKFDVSLLKLSLNLPAVSLNIGRYSFSDVTSSIFSMTSDGINASLSAGLFKIGAYAGYTGLLNGKTASVGATAGADLNAFYPLAAKNVIFLANAAAPNFFGGNTFTVEALGAINLEDAAADGSEAFNSFYGTISAAGPITTTIYYGASVTGSFLTKDSENTGLYANGSVTAYLPFKSMSVALSGSYGSKNFQAISSNPCAFGIMKGGVSATIKPVESMLCLLSADVSSDTVNKSNSASWTAYAKWQALSDVSANLTLNQDIPLSGGSSSFTASAGVTVSF